MLLKIISQCVIYFNVYSTKKKKIHMIYRFTIQSLYNKELRASQYSHSIESEYQPDNQEKQEYLPISRAGSRSSSTRAASTKNNGCWTGKCSRSSVQSSYTITSLNCLLLSSSLPSRAVARSARVAFPSWSLRRLKRSEQLTLIAPRIWLTLYNMNGLQSRITGGTAEGRSRRARRWARSPEVTRRVLLSTSWRWRVPFSAQGLLGRLAVSSLQRFVVIDKCWWWWRWWRWWWWWWWW